MMGFTDEIGIYDIDTTMKAFNELVEIDPDTGKEKMLKLPYNPMDIDFDIDGNIYLRTINILARYDLETMREIPFDYGSEFDKVNGGMNGGRFGPVLSGIVMPATNAVCYHQGGISVNDRGDIDVAPSSVSASPRVVLGCRPCDAHADQLVSWL